LEEYLNATLPEYMVPAAFVQLEQWPLNSNGKIDRKKLPQPEVEIRQQEYVGPRNLTEEMVCQLWQEIIRAERVGIHDNFFRIGGHSLLAAKVATRVRASFNVDIQLRTMFDSPTVAQLAEAIDRAKQAAATNGAPSSSLPAIKRVPRKAAGLSRTQIQHA
jgi:non-ribosomal peptide synthetase component E (peptide arylation enzyme)